jgi:hypothetical protein
MPHVSLENAGRDSHSGVYRDLSGIYVNDVPLDYRLNSALKVCADAVCVFVQSLKSKVAQDKSQQIIAYSSSNSNSVNG